MHRCSSLSRTDATAPPDLASWPHEPCVNSSLHPAPSCRDSACWLLAPTASPLSPPPPLSQLPQVKPIGYNWSYLTCRIGYLVPIWQPLIGSSFHLWCPHSLHGVLEALHGPLHLVDVAGLHVDAELNLGGQTRTMEARTDARPNSPLANKPAVC
jgi:hypothetical protein